MSNRGLIIALAGSMAVNLFVVGLVVGAIGARTRDTVQRPGPGGGNPLMMAGDRLPENVRGQYRAQVRAVSEQALPHLMVARQARQEAARLMTQPDYDAAAVADALKRARDAEVAARGEIEGAVVDFAKDLPRPERRVLAQGLRQPPGAARGRGPRAMAGPPPGGPPPDGMPPPPEAMPAQ